LATLNINFAKPASPNIWVKGTVQQKLTGVLSGINRKLMISSINFYGFFPFKFKGTLVGALQNFRVAFLGRVARAD
jgi:hypothetical protein